MHLPKLIVLDLDGTLLPATKRITRRSQAVLERMQALGAEVTLASGKFLHLTRHYAEVLGLATPVVALDGARVAHDGVELAERCIELETARLLLESYDDPDWDLFADSGEDELLLRSTRPEFAGATSAWADRVRNVADLRDSLVASPAILAFYGPPAEMASLSHEIGERFPALRVALHHSELMDCGRVVVQPRGVSKGSGLRTLMERLEVAPEEGLVFGDWYNDLPMFELGCVNVGMSDAVPELKARAHHVTERSCEEDGVADFLERHFL